MMKMRASYLKVADLDPNERGANLVVDVLDVKVVCENRRPNGSVIYIAEVLVGDDSGCVILTARNEQIELLRKNKTVVLRNSKVDMYKNFMRLSVDKWGKITPHPDNLASTPEAPKNVNRTHNLSLLEYEQVDQLVHER